MNRITGKRRSWPSRRRRISIELLEERRLLATVTVNATTDVDDGNTSSIAALNATPGADGVISLREAIAATNNTANSGGPDEIHFSIPSEGPAVIQPLTELPEITEPTVIDGFTQSGPDHQLVINGDLLDDIADPSGSDNLIAGLTLAGGDSTLRGLVINGFSDSSAVAAIQVRSDGNVIEGNFIGTDETAASGVANDYGVRVGARLDDMILFTGSGNLIGGSDPTDANLIAFNTAVGVSVEGGVGNSILGNSIHDNGGLGIDLISCNEDPFGVTIHDAGDVDLGANNLQNFPLIEGVFDGAFVSGSLESTPGVTFRIEFFGNLTADPSGHGEGEIFLGFAEVTTDDFGIATFAESFSPSAPPELIRATATNLVTGDTSEFSGPHGELRQLDFGDAPDPYPTLCSDDGARHLFLDELRSNNPFIGRNRPDADADGIPDEFAAGDDVDDMDDEDGLEQGSTVLIAGEAYRLFIREGNTGLLSAWMDYNRDGDWDDVGEQIITNREMFNRGFIQSVDIDIPRDAVPGPTMGRFRISTQADLTPTGLASDGEVEDHRFLISGLDFGDAPDSYGTTFASDGARHATIRGEGDGQLPFALGSLVDNEFDGVPGTGADSDDTTGDNDADGVSGLDVAMVPGTMHPITVDVTVPSGVFEAYLTAWVDFNGDGDFIDSGESALFEFLDLPVAGPLSFNLDVPSGAVLGPTFARFRLTSESGIGPDGLGVDGEVEDYLVTIGSVDCSLDVTTTVDGGPGSLREAIICANATPGPDEIVLAPGTYRLDLVGADEDAAAVGDLDVTDELTVRSSSGNPDDVTIDASLLDPDGAGPSFGDRVFDAHSSILRLDGLTISAGSVEGDGGGVRTQDALLALADVRIDGNLASGAGGGIYATNATVEVRDESRIENNQAVSDGGGIALIATVSGTLDLSDSTIENNSSDDDGGGVSLEGDNGTIVRSTIANNQANSSGGGVAINRGTLTVTNSTVSGNTSRLTGGGFDLVTDSTLAIINGTIVLNHANTSENVSDDPGGGIYMTDSTSSATLHNTILASNLQGSGTGNANDLGGKSLVATSSFNIIGVDGISGLTDGANGNQIGTRSAPIDPMLGPLADNGGPTFSHSLLIDSPATNAGSNAEAVDDLGAALTTDQRGVGFPRIINSTVDVGAFETDAQPAPTVGIANSATVTEGGTAQFSVTISRPLSTGEQVVVTYNTADDTAIAPGDYTAVSGGTLIFDPGDPLTKGINIISNDDDEPEDDESFDVAITATGVSAVSSPSAVGTIADDDDACSLVVTHTGDSGFGSLREAIVCANATANIDRDGDSMADPDPISFEIPGSGPHTIQLLSSLPIITDPVIIDGFTQGSATVDSSDDAVPNTRPLGQPIDAVMKIEIDGSQAGFARGLEIASGGSTIRGLVINQFSLGGILLDEGGDNLIEGNFIGTNVTGDADLGNGSFGLFAAESGGNTIGGTTAAARNLISGNDGGGVGMQGIEVIGNVLQGNLIGTNAAGTGALGNNGTGVLVIGTLNAVGGPGEQAGNVIAANADGIEIVRSNNLVQSNWIGTDVSGTVDLGNTGPGVFINDGTGNQVLENVIAFNGISSGGTGVALSFRTAGNPILSNSIFSNEGLGIDLSRDGLTANDEGDSDTGSNNLQNYPLLDSAISGATSTMVAGSLSSLPEQSFLIQFFANDEIDPSGFGEGRTLVGETVVATDAGGNAAINFETAARLSPGLFVTATATLMGDPQFVETSEFSAAVEVAVPSADLSIDKVVDNMAPRQGALVTFTATLSNAGTDTATNIQVADAIPAGLTNVTVTPSHSSIYVDGVWSISSLAASGSVTLTIAGQVDSTSAITNTAEVVAVDQADPDSTPGNHIGSEDDQDSATATPAAAAADLSLSKSVSNSRPNVGQEVTFTISINNDGPDDASGVDLTDLLPAGLTFLRSTQTEGTYNDATGVWTIGSLPVDESETLTITAVVTTSGATTNVAEVTAADLPDPDSTPANGVPSEDDQGSVIVTPQVADLSINKSADTDTASQGQQITFTVILTNRGPDVATTIQVSDAIPAGLTNVTVTPSDSSTYAEGIWSLISLAADGAATLTIVGEVDSTGAITNTAEVIAVDQADPDSTPGNSIPGEDDQDSTTVAILAAADLSLTKTVDDAQPNVGDEVTFTLTLTNSGPDPTTGAAVVDRLPAGLTFSGASPTGSYNNATGVWAAGPLGIDQSTTLRITAVVDSAAATSNVAQVTASDQPDPDSTPNNNVASEDDQASVGVTPQVADLSLEKTVDDASANVDQEVTFTIVLNNAGPDAATSVTVADELPEGLQFVSATGTGVYDDQSGVWTVGTMAAGTTALLDIVATLRGESVSNVAQVATSDQFDPDSIPGNNVASEDDQSSTVVGGCLTGGPLSAGMNRLTYSCVTPGGFAAFVMGTRTGSHFFRRWGSTVDIGDPTVPAIGVGNIDGVAVVLVELTEQQARQNWIFQAFEMLPNPKVSNALALPGGLVASALPLGGQQLTSPGAVSAPDPMDVNDDGRVSSLDALVIINQMNRELDQPLPVGETVANRDQALRDYDVNDDGRVSALDALRVINHLSHLNVADGAESESPLGTATPIDMAILNVVPPAATQADSLDENLLRMLADDNVNAHLEPTLA